MIAAPSTPNRRVFFYVDGFNLYYRRLEKNPSLKWLCLKRLSARLCRQIGVVEKVKFFTAAVDGDSTQATTKRLRQMLYWSALRANAVEVIEGLLESRDRPCRDKGCGKTIKFPSEKMSDVNLALHIYRDYLEGAPDVIFVISGDCDILPALKMVSEASAKPGGRKVMKIVCLPIEEDDLLFSRLPLHYKVARTIKLGSSDVSHSQLDDLVSLPGGGTAARPDVWR